MEQSFIWDKQEFENKHPYDYYWNIFEKYYLPMHPKIRSVAQAYRNFLMEEEGKTPEEVLSYKPSPYFYNVTQGRKYKDYHTKIFEFSWQERAEAYDRHINALDEVEKELYLRKSMQEEQEDYNNLTRLFQESLAKLQEKLAKEENINRDFTMMFKDIVDVRREISEGSRKAVGQDKHSKKVQVTEENDKIQIVWEEPF